MTIDIDHWADLYDTNYPESVEYQDAAGNWHTETDPLFPDISDAFQDRGGISKEELLNIGEWKTPSGRILHYLDENLADDVDRWTTVAFHATSEYKAIDSLLELRGVGVPVASCILAMWDPEEYAVIDYRALRALARAQPIVTNQLQPYEEQIRYFDALREYNRSIEAYQFYLDHVRDIAEDEGGIPARKVEIALWTYDKENSQ